MNQISAGSISLDSTFECIVQGEFVSHLLNPSHCTLPLMHKSRKKFGSSANMPFLSHVPILLPDLLNYLKHLGF